jgi:DNA-binding NarL/FixJ family response regulator
MIIKEVGDGKVAISLARMFKKGLRLLIIDLAVPNVPCDKVIREISGIPLHQHMKTIVVMKTMPEKNVLIDLIKSGIKHFYVESVLSEKLPAAVQELLSD